MSTSLVDTVDNHVAYHNFSVPGIRVFPNAFLIFAWCNISHGVYVLRTMFVANNPIFDGVIFNRHNLVSHF